MARRELTKDQIISNVYYDVVKKCFGSIQETLKKAKRQNVEITVEDVRQWMRKQPNSQIKAPRGSNSFTAPFSRFEYQIDVMFITPLASKPKPEVKIDVEKGNPNKH